MLCFIRKVKIPLVAIWLPGTHPPTKRATIQSEVARISLYDLDLDALEAQLAAWGEPRAQARALAREIWRYLYREYSITPHDITPLPSSLQSQLHEEVSIPHPTLLRETLSPEGSTRKVLLGLEDGAQIEAVLLRYRRRYTACVSTQVGCACGCRFCATGHMGFVRQLARGEIVAQVIHFQRWLSEQDQAVSNVVFMGMGEPLLNLEETLGAIQRLTDPRGLAFAPGRITISTAGVAPGIVRLAEIHHNWPTKLAISLHAATDDLRDTLMPINKAYPLEDLYAAVATYTSQTGRRVLFEWVMIADINDSPEQAEALATWLRGLPAHVNLIELNPTAGYAGAPSSPEAVTAFSAILDRYAIPHTMRQRRGGSIYAGCGQLCVPSTRAEGTGPPPM